MRYTDMTLINVDELPFDDTPIELKIPEGERKYKLYHDGSHYIARPSFIYAPSRHIDRYGNGKSDTVKCFDTEYRNAKRLGISKLELRRYVKARVYDTIGAEIDDDFISKRIERLEINRFKREKRFRRKAFLYKWTHFVTVTYDDKKYTSEDSFRNALRRCLSNMAYRHKWRFMYTFERAPETGRLHMHGIFRIPDGESVGKFYERVYYDFKSHNTRVATENSFFFKRFGVNDFEPIRTVTRRNLNYILKYVDKSGERLYYSRGIPEEITIILNKRCLAVELLHDYNVKYVVFDDAIDWDRDIGGLKEYKQLSMFDEDVGVA